MTLLVLGAGGQVGSALVARAGSAAIGLDRAACDIADPASVEAALGRPGITAIANCAAYTAVDRAESERDAAFRINGEGPGVLARAAARRGLPLIHLSTDYVYSGAPGRPWREDDPIAPLSAYGASKAAGDAAVAAAGGRHVILRVSWVFGERGANFVRTMLRLARDRDALRVVADQVGGPTEARDIADAILAVAERCTAPGFSGWGVYHFAGAPATSWCDFAREIFRVSGGRRPEVTAITTAEYPTPAKRPLNSVMDCSRIGAAFGLSQPDWRAALRRVVPALEREETI